MRFGKAKAGNIHQTLYEYGYNIDLDLAFYI